MIWERGDMESVGKNIEALVRMTFQTQGAKTIEIPQSRTVKMSLILKQGKWEKHKI